MKRKLYIHALLFFIPVLVVYGIMEYATRQLPSSFKAVSIYLAENSGEIETLILGPSQILQAVNPALMESTTLSMASGSQHHDTDFKLLKQIRDRLPKLKTVVLEVSYSHFELPHNGIYFWKNPFYLEYYNVNMFERNTYFKDRLLFLANPKYFSEKLKVHYVDGIDETSYNAFGFDENRYSGAFQLRNYDSEKIRSLRRFKINKEPNLALFEYNSAFFFEMLDYLQNEGLNVIICTIPMYATYLQQRTPEILLRRDSVLTMVQEKYPEIRILNRETDTLNFYATDYTNPSHMNPDGARKFTRLLSEVLDSIH